MKLTHLGFALSLSFGMMVGCGSDAGDAQGTRGGPGDPSSTFTPAGDDAGGEPGSGAVDSGVSGDPNGGSDSGSGSDTESDSGSGSGMGAGGAKKIVAYFAAWSVYGRNFHVPDVDASLITHLYYAFANVTGGECVLGDSYADTDKFYPGDTWDAGALRGSFHQLQLLKAKYPKLKTVLSIGGWTWSGGFSDAAATEASRTKFAQSCAALAKKYGFDGLDVDWEYPGGGGMAAGKPEDTANYTLLLAAMRKELDALGDKTYELSIAAPAGPAMIAHLESAKIASIVDSIDVMTYDFHGAWEKTTNHNSPLFQPPGDPAPAGWSTDGAVKAYLAAGVPASKLVIGAAFYGRGWSGVAATNDGLFQAASGASPGTWEQGILDFKDIQANYLPTYAKHRDPVALVPWIYDASKQVMISYDDAESLGARAAYIQKNALGGAMIWELSSDDAAHTLGKALHDGLK